VVLGFLLSTHVGRTGLSVEENWDSEDEAEKAVADEVADEVSGVLTRRLLVSGFVCNFLDTSSASISFVISLVNFQCAF